MNASNDNKTDEGSNGDMVSTTLPADGSSRGRRLEWRRRWVLNRRWLWLSMFVAFATMIVLGGSMVRLPKIAFQPGQISPTEERVTISGVESFPSEGELMYTTVRSRQLNLWTWLEARYDDDDDINDEVSVRQGQTAEESRVCSQAMMRFSQSNATIVALSLLDYDVLTPTGSGIERVFADTAADGIITCNDVIVAINGQTVAAAGDAVDIIGALEPGDVIEVDLEALDGSTRTERIPLGDDGNGNPLLGVRPQTRFDQNELDISVVIDTGQTGGPSAGLAFTLTILDTLTEGELAGPQNIAVTGTIRLDGSVGNVGGVRQKVIAAREGGAAAFIVPRQLRCADFTVEPEDCQFDAEWDAIVESARDLPIYEVTTVFEALGVLEELGGDPLPGVGSAP